MLPAIFQNLHMHRTRSQLSNTELHCFFMYDSSDEVSSLSKIPVSCKKKILFLAQETGTVRVWVCVALFTLELLALAPKELLNRQATI